MSTVYWLHDECLKRPDAITESDRLISVWDHQYLFDQAWSLKRLVFLYESLCSLGCDIYQAHINEVLTHLSARPEVSEIVTWEAQDPRLNRMIENAKCCHPNLQVRPQPNMVDMNIRPPVKRFFHYWKRTEATLTGGRNRQTSHRVK
ncbi:hypothetical protein [Hydrogenovibrio halophilus]|uniref:hypothetical protein n=1 Tax=Hydrogenovibrio halophilus TaxID=373391 RepID=UPI00037D4A73|nr:hypothetical protein [Hydrogenovibrio halophilus]